VEQLTDPWEAGAVNNNGMAVMSIRGSLDVVTTSGAMGWAYSPGSPDSLTVQALLHHTVIGEAVSDNFRPDLAEVGLGDGNCGYSITFYNQVDPIYLPFVVVKPEGSDLEFPRSTTSGYGDFFRRLYERYPATGRHRSVFGGLWTDRVDAAAVLKGRCDIGMIRPEIEQNLSRFIQSGLLIVNDAAPIPTKPVSRSGRSGSSAFQPGTVSDEEVADVLRTVLQGRTLLELMHAILEDHPLVFSAKRMTNQQQFCQPSAFEALQSPAECLAIVVPLGMGDVELDVVRDSHLFPEFTAEGQSRWENLSGNSFVELARRSHGMADRYKTPPGNVAIIGPGLIHNVHAGSDVLRMLCVPSRQAPLARITGSNLREIALESGIRVWL
jgi:hypothetical protein